MSPPATEWITTVEAAKMLGVKPSFAGGLVGLVPFKTRTAEDNHTVTLWLFDRSAVEKLIGYPDVGRMLLCRMRVQASDVDIYLGIGDE